MEKINVGGILFDNVSMNEAVVKMENRIKNPDSKETSLLCVANQDIINRIKENIGISLEQINKAFLIVPDGYSIVYASKYLGNSLKQRVTGPDLMLEFLKITEQKGYKNFFLGAREGVAQKMADMLLEKHPDIQICGIYSPPFGDFTSEENNKIITMVNEAATDVLWVSFGCPKQEKWIIENHHKINAPICAGVGAAFDFHSNNIKRAPIVFQKLRLEWFYRFLQEPRRLWKRYFIGGIKFIKTISRQKKTTGKKRV